MRIAAAIPAYRAAGMVGDVVRRTLRIVPHLVVVDDGSDDGTGDEARAAGARVLTHDLNRGKGAALATAFADLFGHGCDAVVTLDADGQHRPEEIPKLVTAFAPGTGLVLGTRAHLFAQMHGVRRASNTLSSLAISAVAGRRLLDVQTGFRIYSRELWERAGMPEPRFEAESAVVVRAARMGLPIVSVPIEMGPVDGRHTSHYRPLVDSLRIARAVSRARFEKGGRFLIFGRQGRP